MKIKSIPVGEKEKTFVIAEMGINHNGDVETARQMLNEAAQAGVAAVKFQTYKTEKRVKPDSPIFDLLKQCELSSDDIKKLRKEAANLGIAFGSTPFDGESVELLAELDVDFIKIASMDLCNYPLIKQIIDKRKQIIVSTGMSTKEELMKTISFLESNKCDAAVLHCTTLYPVTEKNINLSAIKTLKDLIDFPIGFSDHSLGYAIPVFAVVVGACIIEKHFTLDTDMPGPDQKLSADPEILKKMIQRIKKVEEILGNGDLVIQECEKAQLQFKRVVSLEE